MDTDLLITPEDAKTFAKKLFAVCHPEHELWFDAAWEVLEETGAENITSSVNKQIAGLAAAGDSSSELLTMADDFAMFFEMFMLKSPVLGTSLAERIQKIAKQRSGGNFGRTKLLKRFSSVLDIEPTSSVGSNEKQKNQGLCELIKEQFAETNELIKTGHQAIKSELNTTVVDHNYLTNWKIKINKKFRLITIDTGKNQKTFSDFSNLQIEIILALVKHGMPGNQPGDFVFWDKLIEEIPKWKNNPDTHVDDDDIRRHIMNIKNLFGKDYSKIIESKRLYGYRISTNPANITVE